MSTFCEQKLETKSGMHAVVIGGSIAGLLAARVLTNYFDFVTMLSAIAYQNSHCRVRESLKAAMFMCCLPKDCGF